MPAGISAISGHGHWAVEVKTTGKLAGRTGVWFPQGWPEGHRRTRLTLDRRVSLLSTDMEAIPA